MHHDRRQAESTAVQRILETADSAGPPVKTVYTTGEVAQICNISQQTVIRCFDNGRLGGFKVPGSDHRRIPRDLLLQFMKENSIPAENLDSGKRRVLIVDDDEAIIEMLVDLLTHDGRFEVRAATTGFDAGAITKEFRPDLMILDYMLPDINGNKVCEMVRKDPELASMKIIIVSGAVDQSEIDSLVAVGADEFIKKPFDMERLVSRMAALLRV